MLENLDICVVKEYANKVELDINNSLYLRSYNYFVTYFKSISKIEKDHLIISCHFVYGWMPTIIKKIDFDKIDYSLILLNKVKQGNLLNDNELADLKPIINNSLVGLSKLLHFINPELYAIWDSRIYRFTTGKEPYNDRVNNIPLYQEYNKQIKSITDLYEYQNIHEKIVKQLGYKVSKNRSLELILFEADKQNAQ